MLDRTQTPICIFAFACTFAFAFTYICTLTFTYICTLTCTLTNTLTNAFIYIYTYLKSATGHISSASSRISLAKLLRTQMPV